MRVEKRSDSQASAVLVKEKLPKKETSCADAAKCTEVVTEGKSVLADAAIVARVNLDGTKVDERASELEKEGEEITKAKKPRDGEEFTKAKKEVATEGKSVLADAAIVARANVDGTKVDVRVSEMDKEGEELTKRRIRRIQECTRKVGVKSVEADAAIVAGVDVDGTMAEERAGEMDKEGEELTNAKKAAYEQQTG